MADRPNIVLIMTDQQRGDCLSIEGHPVLQTPNMDHIGGQGARFTRAYVTCPSCIAARRSLLSGQHPQTHGLVGYQDAVNWDPPATLPQALRDAGYQTAVVGRSMHQHPPRRRYGFEQMTVHGGADSDYGLWLEEKVGRDPGGWMGGGVMHNDWTARPWPLEEYLHSTNWTVQQALEFLRIRDPSVPFFLLVSFIAPHPPLQPPAFYMDRYLRLPTPEPIIGDWAQMPQYDGLGDDVAPGQVNLTGERLRAARAGYYGLINHVDDQIRRLLNPVNGIDRRTNGNTVVLFTSDHGEMLGDHHLWRKQWSYEPAARVPLMIRGPQRLGIGPRAVIDAPVCLEDIMPTLLDVANVPIPASVEGRSLLPLIRGEKPQWREMLHIEHAPLHQSLTNGKEKYVWIVADGREQLFDLGSDPQERHNLAGDAGWQERLTWWRDQLLARLKDRPEGFVAEGKLIPGRSYRALLPHGGKPDTHHLPIW